MVDRGHIEQVRYIPAVSLNLWLSPRAHLSLFLFTFLAARALTNWEFAATTSLMSTKLLEFVIEVSPDLVLKLLQSSSLIYETKKTWNVNEEEPSAATNGLTLAGSPLARFGFDISSQERNVLKTLFGKHCKDWFRNHCLPSVPTHCPQRLPVLSPPGWSKLMCFFFWNKVY